MKQETKQNSITDEIKEAPQEITPAEQETENPYVIYNNDLEIYTDDFILQNYPNKSKEELKQDKAFFPWLIQYLYNNYIGDLLGNKQRKNNKIVYPDIDLLNCLFDAYINLIYKYKWNNRPSILEFSLLTGISRETIYKWLNGEIDNNYIYSDNENGKEDKKRHLTKQYIDSARKWQTVCEQALVDGNGEMVKEIFLLKARHGYRDNSNDIQITVNHKAIIDADNLPDLIGITSKN